MPPYYSPTHAYERNPSYFKTSKVYEGLMLLQAAAPTYSLHALYLMFLSLPCCEIVTDYQPLFGYCNMLTYTLE